MATQNESILALLRLTETKWVPKWPIESLFDSIVKPYAEFLTRSSIKIPEPSITMINLNNTYHTFHSILPEANELICFDDLYDTVLHHSWVLPNEYIWQYM